MPLSRYAAATAAPSSASSAANAASASSHATSTRRAAATAKPKSLSKQEEERIERRRKQCRISQRRYRDKKGSMEYNLQLDVNNLRENVSRLMEARMLLQDKIFNYRHSMNGSVLKAVEQYYMMFRTGLHCPDAGANAQKCHDIQVNFLQAFMHPDVAMSDHVGLPRIYEQWKRYTAYHGTLMMTIEHAEVFGTESAPIVKVNGKLAVRINRATLENMFPSAVADEELVQQLIGKQCEYKTCTEYVFDAKNQVIRQDLYVDFLTSLTALVGDSVRALELIRKAKIKHDCILGDDEETTDNKGEEQDKKRTAKTPSFAGKGKKRERPTTKAVEETKKETVETSPPPPPRTTTMRSSRHNLCYIMD